MAPRTMTMVSTVVVSVGCFDCAHRRAGCLIPTTDHRRDVHWTNVHPARYGQTFTRG